MHFLSRGLILGILIACSAPTAAPQPLDGVWNLQSAFSGFAPRTMTLKQSGSRLSGTGSATGVDRPIPIAVSGSYTAATPSSPPLVALSFKFADNGQLAAKFDGALRGPDRIDGSVISYGNDPPLAVSVFFTRQ
jgi:hypothetical protein